MPANITPVATWDTPQTVVGADVANAASIENVAQRLADRDEYLKKYALEDSTAWPRTARLLRVPLELGRAIYSHDWRFNETDPYDSANRAALDAYTNSGLISFPLTSVLRVGMTITGVTIMARAAAARTGGNRITIDLRKQEHNTVAATVYASTSVATGTGGTSSARELISTGAISEVVATGFEYRLIVKAGNDASTNHDQVLDVFLIVTDPGPRNVNG